VRSGGQARAGVSAHLTSAWRAGCDSRKGAQLWRVGGLRGGKRVLRDSHLLRVHQAGGRKALA